MNWDARGEHLPSKHRRSDESPGATRAGRASRVDLETGARRRDLSDAEQARFEGYLNMWLFDL